MQAPGRAGQQQPTRDASQQEEGPRPAQQEETQEEGPAVTLPAHHSQCADAGTEAVSIGRIVWAKVDLMRDTAPLPWPAVVISEPRQTLPDCAEAGEQGGSSSGWAAGACSPACCTGPVCGPDAAFATAWVADG